MNSLFNEIIKKFLNLKGKRLIVAVIVIELILLIVLFIILMLIR